MGDQRARAASGNFNPNQPIPVHQRAMVKIVGITDGQATTLFQDQDNANGQSIMLFTPALTNKLLACCSNDMVSALTLQGGDRHLSAVEAAVTRVAQGSPVRLPGVTEHHCDRQRHAAPGDDCTQCLRRHHGIAALLIAGQVISRRVRLRAPDLDIARALGADPPMCLWDGLLGSLGALLLGSLLAALVAVACRRSGPSGRCGRSSGWRSIRTGRSSGSACYPGLVLGGVAVLASFHSLPDRARNRAGRFTSSRVTSAATRTGLPPAAVTGVRFALEPGVGRSAVPVRSAILGAILAVTVVVATVTFGSSLNTLVSHPALYGWNWNYDMDGGGGLGDIPGQRAAKLLDADPLVQSWTGIYYSALTLDGVNVPVMGATPGATVAPPLLSGHGLQAPNQIVLGASTLRSLHKQLGDTVQVRIPGTKPVTLTIVGTATLPPIGVVGSSHLEMGTGAVLSYRIIPPAARNLFEGPAGPNAILVRTKGGNSPAALASLQAIGRRADIAINGGSVFGVVRPAPILNYGSLGTTPLLLGATLALGAAAALGITLVTSVRRRRHDLAILKTLGFTRGQLATAVAVQASVAAVIGCAIGIPPASRWAGCCGTSSPPKSAPCPRQRSRAGRWW